MHSPSFPQMYKSFASTEPIAQPSTSQDRQEPSREISSQPWYTSLRTDISCDACLEKFSGPIIKANYCAQGHITHQKCLAMRKTTCPVDAPPERQAIRSHLLNKIAETGKFPSRPFHWFFSSSCNRDCAQLTYQLFDKGEGYKTPIMYMLTEERVFDNSPQKGSTRTFYAYERNHHGPIYQHKSDNTIVFQNQMQPITLEKSAGFSLCAKLRSAFSPPLSKEPGVFYAPARQENIKDMSESIELSASNSNSRSVGNSSL